MAVSANAVTWPSTLTAQLGNGRWTRAGLLAVLAKTLPPDFPTICFGTEVICVRGIYRNVDRTRDGTVVRIERPEGAREFAPLATSRAFRTWLETLSRHRAADPHRAASRLCCADLAKSLTSFEDFQRTTWTKHINPSDWQPVDG